MSCLSSRIFGKMTVYMVGIYTYNVGSFLQHSTNNQVSVGNVFLFTYSFISNYILSIILVLTKMVRLLCLIFRFYLVNWTKLIEKGNLFILCTKWTKSHFTTKKTSNISAILRSNGLIFLLPIKEYSQEDREETAPWRWIVWMHHSITTNFMIHHVTMHISIVDT